jgi:hypothetical protein
MHPWEESEMHPKVHVGSSVPNFMDDWTPLDIETDAASEQKALEVNLEGLTVDASTLQAHFEQEESHLDEVKQRHLEVLVTAGMLPETGLASNHPERALAWVLSSINGRINPDGLTIPLLGTTPDRVNLQTKVTDNQTLVQLNIDDGDLPALVRDLPLPLEAAETLQATFVEGHLHLRW